MQTRGCRHDESLSFLRLLGRFRTAGAILVFAKEMRTSLRLLRAKNASKDSHGSHLFFLRSESSEVFLPASSRNSSLQGIKQKLAEKKAKKKPQIRPQILPKTREHPANLHHPRLLGRLLIGVQGPARPRWCLLTALPAHVHPVALFLAVS